METPTTWELPAYTFELFSKPYRYRHRRSANRSGGYFS